MSRTHVLLAAIVLALGGVFVGLKVGERHDSSSETSAKPAVPAAAATAQPEPAPVPEADMTEPPSDGASEPSDPVADEAVDENKASVDVDETDEADDSNKADEADNADQADMADEADSATELAAVEDEPKKRKRRRAKRARKKRASKTKKVAKKVAEPEPSKSGARTETVDGVVIASDADDPEDVAAKTKSNTASPSRVGKTPIAEGFD